MVVVVLLLLLLLFLLFIAIFQEYRMDLVKMVLTL